ncbi:hypothetical protein PP175_29305 (plasmid) [Aneurinibacillus sp. Ricciae_BoGa-3]|uniref:hypothetical protein n=1 Tax=Aneurinibacillus sp. Ricciae_BoGa-3 TaxID=3022697 RepID=UPI002340866F|nr:hypothetical protein [Aneurinibacillus sp. Ricciae_BoGa-3]WCK57290.1 hypothetical protein PP175_29305 [Aneurinibacillus sp. Ricciae_BoGa-3]
MCTKREKLLGLLTELQELAEKEKNIEQIQEAIHAKRGLSLDATLHIENKAYSLTNLLGGTSADLFQNFEGDISIFMEFLLRKNRLEQEELLNRIELKEDEDIHQENNSTPSSDTRLEKTVLSLVENYEKGDSINPEDIYEKLDTTIQQAFSLSDIHEFLRHLANKGEMKLVYYAHCHRCESYPGKYYEKIPHALSCYNCGNEIVDIQMHYQKLV